MPKRRRGLRPVVVELDDRCLLSAGLTPAQITSAYGLNAITFSSSSGSVSGTGAGETIALIEMYHDPNLASDLHVFDQKYGLPDPTLNVIDQASGQTDSSWGQEESLDVEWAHAIAPGASILVVEAAPSYSDTQALQNLMTAVQTAGATPGIAVVSMSWGFNEFPGETQYDSYFTTPGITYIAASGDTPGVEYPAASPDVLAVGGTSLSLGAWAPTATRPPGTTAAAVIASSSRSRPISIGPGDRRAEHARRRLRRRSQHRRRGLLHAAGRGRLLEREPAGFVVDRRRHQRGRTVVGRDHRDRRPGPRLAGLSNLAGATQTLPSLYSLAAGSQTSGDFHSIAASPSGTPWSNNPGFGFPWGGFGGWGDWGWETGSGSGSLAGATANTQTGLGTSNGSTLLNDLAVSTVTAPLPSPTPTPSPIPTPSPTPTPTPTPTQPVGKHHHRRKAAHGRAQGHVHVAAAHGGRVVKQGLKIAKPSEQRHRG